MKWSEAYATGIERIDRQHRTLFKALDDFRAALDAGEGSRTYGGLLDFLADYSRAHFGYEERCMDEWQCPIATSNKEAHAQFVVLLGGFRDRWAASGYSAAAARALVDTLDQWLHGHIGGTDVQLRGCVRRDPGGAGSPS